MVTFGLAGIDLVGTVQLLEDKVVEAWGGYLGTEDVSVDECDMVGAIEVGDVEPFDEEAEGDAVSVLQGDFLLFRLLEAGC